MKILVAIDCSTYADEVLEQLATRPWPQNSDFHIVSAVESSSNWETEQTLLHQCAVIMDRRVDLLRKRLPGACVTGHIREGRAAEVILKCAADFDADLLVLGSHGDTGKRLPSIGSVAAEVVNQALCTVEVVKLRQPDKLRAGKVEAAGTCK